ncbi:hypothetical protein GCM10009715_06680 [Paeniglutamicibacter psychrophenolicus]|uniref:DUF4235 domain-containing protein n=2 Tax=Micrococcales TaxID=85006 RepID=A0ABS4WGS8_9MICC|nr:hypothetical protein [Paeniglutamicibacter psychrophenolicus]
MRIADKIGLMVIGMGMWVGTRTMDLAGNIKRNERGDVPGWVMITLMSALLVAALLAIAGPRLEELFNQAIDRVAGMG